MGKMKEVFIDLMNKSRELDDIEYSNLRKLEEEYWQNEQLKEINKVNIGDKSVIKFKGSKKM